MPKCDLKTRYIPATFAWTLLIVATTLFFYYPAQYYISDHPWVPAYQGVITFFVLANFTLATFMDPGVIPKAPPDEDREDDFRAPLYKNVDINGITVRMKWCVTCKFYRPPRCSHCSVCNHCIETFDHHCPWVNNCIGRRNYRFFFFFLISLSIHMISIFTLSLIFILKSGDDYTKPQPIISIVLIILVALLSIPIFGLTGFHMVLVSRGRTTNEQVTGKFKGGYNPFSRGCWDNCCYTQFGPQFPSLMKPHKYYTKRKHCPHGPIATITNDSQVKTYMDNSNGVRNINSNAYNKMSPGRDGCELDMEPSASQSQDCEPTPPLQRHGSKSNFFLPPAAGVGVAHGGGESPPRPRGGAGGQHYAPPRHSPHPRPRGIDPNRSSTPDSLGPSQRPSPTMQQRIKALGVPTPLALSSPVRRSNPSTPTQPRRPDFIGVVYAPNAAQGAAHYYDFQPAAPHHHHHQFHHHASQQQQRFQEQGAASAAAQQRALMAEGQGAPLSTGWQHQVGGYGSPQRRFVSEGELEAAHQLSHPPPRSNNTVDNIRELANSPQRGVYMWKDASSPPGGGGGYHPPPPPGDFHRSNPTSPTQQQQQVYVAAAAPQARGYHPAGRGGVPVFPPQSPQVHRKTPAAGAPTVRRPMSFVRALEMSDTATQASDGPPAQASRGAGPLQQRAATPDRGSVYDMNYEISV